MSRMQRWCGFCRKATTWVVISGYRECESCERGCETNECHAMKGAKKPTHAVTPEDE